MTRIIQKITICCLGVASVLVEDNLCYCDDNTQDDEKNETNHQILLSWLGPNCRHSLRGLLAGFDIRGFHTAYDISLSVLALRACNPVILLLLQSSEIR